MGRSRRGSSLAELERKHRHGPPWFDDTGGRLFAIDLGKRKVGIALFDEDGVCIDAATLRCPDPWSAEDMAGIIAEWMLRRYETGCSVVAEWPEHWEQRRDTHKNIDQLLKVGDRLPIHEKYRPSTWKSTIPKRVHQARVAETLTTSERAIWDANGHDAKDAIAIGLFALGRISRAGVEIP